MSARREGLTTQRIRGALQTAGLPVLSQGQRTVVGIHVTRHFTRRDTWEITYALPVPSGRLREPWVDQERQEHLDQAAAALRGAGLHVTDSIRANHRGGLLITAKPSRPAAPASTDA